MTQAPDPSLHARIAWSAVAALDADRISVAAYDLACRRAFRCVLAHGPASGWAVEGEVRPVLDGGPAGRGGLVEDLVRLGDAWAAPNNGALRQAGARASEADRRRALEEAARLRRDGERHRRLAERLEARADGFERSWLRERLAAGNSVMDGAHRCDGKMARISFMAGDVVAALAAEPGQDPWSLRDLLGHGFRFVPDARVRRDGTVECLEGHPARAPAVREAVLDLVAAALRRPSRALRPLGQMLRARRAAEAERDAERACHSRLDLVAARLLAAAARRAAALRAEGGSGFPMAADPVRFPWSRASALDEGRVRVILHDLVEGAQVTGIVERRGGRWEALPVAEAVAFVDGVRRTLRDGQVRLEMERLASGVADPAAQEAAGLGRRSRLARAARRDLLALQGRRGHHAALLAALEARHDAIETLVARHRGPTSFPFEVLITHNRSRLLLRADERRVEVRVADPVVVSGPGGPESLWPAFVFDASGRLDESAPDWYRLGGEGPGWKVWAEWLREDAVAVVDLLIVEGLVGQEMEAAQVRSAIEAERDALAVLDRRIAEVEDDLALAEASDLAGSAA